MSVLLLLAGCANPFRDLPDKGKSDYRIDAAKSALDNYDFTTAISDISPVLAANPQDEQVAYIASAAYAGRAGLRVLDLVSAVTSGLSTKGILRIFAEFFTGSTDTSITDIDTAVSIIEAYGARSVNRSADMNFFALFVYYSRIGVYLNRYAFDSVSGAFLTSNPQFLACKQGVTPTASTTGIPDSSIDKIMITLPRIVDTAAGVAAAGTSFDALKSLETLLDTYVPGGVPFDPLPCTTTPNDPKCLGVRTLIAASKAENGIGLGTGEGVCAGVTP